MVFNLSEQASVANQFLADLRSADRQKDRMRFRKNVERLGEILAYEMSKKLRYEITEITTPLGRSPVAMMLRYPVLVTVLRAGIPFFQGFLNFFDQSDCGFIGAYRKEDENDVSVTLDYLSIGAISNRELFLIDPMIATGKSVVKAMESILKKGTPSAVYVASLIAATEGLEYVEKNIRCSVYTCAIDEKLNDQFFIVPGLGDAGDLAFGSKH